MRTVLCACLLLILTFTGASAQFGFLYRSGVEITGEDRDIVGQTVRSILNDGEVGDSLEWSNPDSGLNGETTLLERFEDDAGTPCANLLIEAQRDGNTAPFRMSWCQRPDGRWGMAG